MTQRTVGKDGQVVVRLLNEDGLWDLSLRDEEATLHGFKRSGAIQPSPKPPPQNEAAQDLTQWDIAGLWQTFRENPAVAFRLAREYGAAVLSRVITGPVGLAILEFRFMCCTGRTRFGHGEQVTEQCPSLRVTEDGMFCGNCKCGKRKAARIDITVNGKPESSKLAFPSLRCPSLRFGPMPGRWLAGARLLYTRAMGAIKS